MSEAEFRQEYEADFNTYEGQVWNQIHECVGSFQETETLEWMCLQDLTSDIEILLLSRDCLFMG